MPDIVAAADETAATNLVHDAEATLGTVTKSGSGSLGPFNANWSASASVSGGMVDLIPPDIIRIADCDLNYALSFSFSFDLSSILPDFCLPQVCIPIPFDGSICTPKICVDWPTVTIPVSHSGVVKFTSDFSLVITATPTHWLIDIVIVGVPFLQIGPAAAAIIVALGIAAAAAIAWVPFIGPVLAIAVLGITSAIAIAGVTGFLGPILSLFVAGLQFNIYKQPKHFQVIPAGGPVDPAVFINLDSIKALVDGSAGEDELVIQADISP
jgi:hypothetical protein